MKNKLLLLFTFILFEGNSIIAQQYVPIPVTGYNLDGVAENTTAVSTTGGAMDASDFVLYSQYYGTLFGGPTVGLPNNGLIASGTRTYQLQSYTGNNTMHLLANTADTLVFTTPQAFPGISLLCFGTQGNATASITVRFTDNSTQVFPSNTLTDWFSIASPVYSGFDRVQRSSGSPALVGGAGNPRMLGLDLAILCANQGKAISRVIIRNTSASAHVCVMAVSGAVPVYAVNANTLICSGSSASLSASGFVTYTWQPVGGFPGSNASTVVVSPTVNTTYTLTGTDGLGCPGYTTVAVTVNNSLPVLSLSGSTQSVCLGAAATITASGAMSYTFSSPAPNGGSFVPVATSVYTVQGSNGCGTSSITITITVSPLTITATASNGTVCAGSTTTLTGLGASTYTWLPGAGTQSVFLTSPLANTVYTLTGKTSSCIATTTIAISTNPLPSMNIVSSGTSICAGESVSLSVSGTANSYTWIPGNINSTSIVVSPASSTIYVVSGVNAFNCSGTAQQFVVVYNNPTVNVSASLYSVCPGGSTSLTATGANTYTWSTSDISSVISVSPVSSQIYTVNGSSSNNCSSSATVQITVLQTTLLTSGNTSVCIGKTTTIGAGGASTYTWANNGFNTVSLSVSPSVTTTYTISGTVNYPQAGISCNTSTTILVSALPNPVLSATANRTIICKGEKATLTASSNINPLTFVWSTGSSTLSGSSTTVAPILQQNYTVTGTDANGCEGSAQILVKVALCTGIMDLINPEVPFGIFPNPAKNNVQISGRQNLSLILTNCAGQVLREFVLSEENGYSVKLDNLNPGIYFVRSLQTDLPYSAKLIVTEE